MSNELPLKIRADIRDLWDSPKAALQSSVEELSKTLGHKIVPRTQWPLLYGALKGVSSFEDKAQFVPNIVHLATAFYDRLLSKLENESNEEWTETLLNELAKKPSGSEYVLQIEVTDSHLRRPRVIWKASLEVFNLELSATTLPLDAQINAGFDEDLDNLFKAKTSLASTHVMSSGATSSLNDDEWAEVTSLDSQGPSRQQSIASPGLNHSLLAPPAKPKMEKLPDIHRLARPADLLKTTAPYILIVDASACPLIIQGSHQPSLELIAAYLNKWAKTNSNDSSKRPVLRVDLIESPFCFGVIDAISIEPTIIFNSRTQPPLNPVLILGFVEGVLGYKETHTTGYRWVFKLETVLK